MKTILWEGKEIPVIISARKSVAIVVKNGKIEVRAPRGTGTARILAFLNQKKNWVLKHAERKPIVSDIEKTIWYRGQEYPVAFAKKAELKDGVFYTPDKERSIAWLKKDTVRVLVPELKAWAKKVGRGGEKKTRITGATGRWASNGTNINLNWRLVCLPPEIAEYVLVHELAHEFYRGHRADFWKQVEKFMPDYRIRNKNLKSFSFLMSEY